MVKGNLGAIDTQYDVDSDGLSGLAHSDRIPPLPQKWPFSVATALAGQLVFTIANPTTVIGNDVGDAEILLT